MAIQPVLVFGTICIDRVRRVPSLPRVGGYVEIVDEMFLLGGEAANTANALNEWGVPVLLAGNSLGSRPDSTVLRSMLEERGLSSALLPDDGGVTPVCDIYVTPDGERTMFGKGFSRMAASSHLHDVPFREGGWFTAEPNMGKLARDAVRAAYDAGMRVYAMDFIQPDDPCEPGSYWQCSTDWVGFRADIQRNIAWVREFVARKQCFCVLSDGPNGFVAGGPGFAVRHYAPYSVNEIVDSTGAGDMFRAGMLYGLTQDWPYARCLQFASAAGALVCRGLGATTYVPSQEDIARLWEEQPEVSGQFR